MIKLKDILNLEDVKPFNKKGKDGGEYRKYTPTDDSDIEQPYRPKKKLKKNKDITEAGLKRRKKKRKKIKRPSQKTRLMRQQRRYYMRRDKAEKELAKSGLPGKISSTKMGKMRVFFVSYKKPKTNMWGTGRVLNKENIKLKDLVSEGLPTKLGQKYKKMKDEPDSLGGNNFKKQHSTSMGDGERGSLGEPDTYDWDDDMIDDPGYQFEPDDEKKGYEPVRVKESINEADLIKFKDKDNNDKQIDAKTALQYGTHPPEGYQQYQHPAYKALMKQKPDLAKDLEKDKKKSTSLDKKEPSTSKSDVKSQFKQQSKVANALAKKYGVNSKIKFSNNLDSDDFAHYDVDRDEINISMDKNKDPQQFLTSVLHEIDHARDAKKMGAENYKDDYTIKGQMAVEKGGDFHDDNPYEIKAEKWARKEYQNIKDKIDIKKLASPPSPDPEPTDEPEEPQGPSQNVFGVEKENPKFVFDKPRSDDNPVKPSGIPSGINWDGMNPQERMNYLKSVTDKKMIDEYKQRVSEETVNLGKKLGIKRDKNGTLSFHVDSPSRGPYSESQTQDTKYFDKLYFGDHPPEPVYENDESDKIVEWNYNENSPLQLDESELKSVESYQNGDHRSINSYLRGQKKVTPGTPTEQESKIANVKTKAIDKVFEKLPVLPESIKVHRRAWDDKSGWIDQMNEGDIFEDSGFVSTSTDGRLPDQYGDVKFEIIVPAGQKALYMNSLKSFSNENQFDIGYQAEKEVLLPRGKKFRIVKKEGKKFNYKITLEMIGEDDG